MKILLDENISRTLTINFARHEVISIEDVGWAGKKNGELLRLLIRHSFDAMVTTDKNIRHQHNFKDLPITIFVLLANSNRDETIQPLIDMVRKKLNSKKLNKGIIEIKIPKSRH
jgi:hypothetical protein